jgi:hypothetical protein
MSYPYGGGPPGGYPPAGGGYPGGPGGYPQGGGFTGPSSEGVSIRMIYLAGFIEHGCHRRNISISSTQNITVNSSLFVIKGLVYQGD